MNYSFWVLADNDGIVSVKHNKYVEVKAVFPTLELAKAALELQGPNSGLTIEEVEITGI